MPAQVSIKAAIVSSYNAPYGEYKTRIGEFQSIQRWILELLSTHVGVWLNMLVISLLSAIGETQKIEKATLATTQNEGRVDQLSYQVSYPFCYMNTCAWGVVAKNHSIWVTEKNKTNSDWQWKFNFK